MSKIRFQQLVIAVLLVTNILLLLFGFILRRPPHDPDRPKRMVIEKLHFDDAQIQEYEKYIAWHRRQVNEKNRKIIELKGKLYTLLKSPEETTEEEQLIEQIGEVQQEVETIHFDHFLQIKSICRKDQIPEFNRLADEITAVFMMKRPH